jgi:mannosyltransferase
VPPAGAAVPPTSVSAVPSASVSAVPSASVSAVPSASVSAVPPASVSAVPPAGAAQRRGRGWAAAAGKYAPVGIAAVAMAVLGLWGLARNSSMGNDEVATRWAALLSLRDLAHLLNTIDAVHGLYYLVMRVWVAVGTSPTVLRVPSVLAMIVAVALTAILAKRLTGSGWVALFSGLVMALTPVITYYAQTARSYAMVLACVVGATLVLLHALNAEVTGAAGKVVARRWVAYGALVTLGGYLNELSLLIVAAHAVTVLLARYGRRTVRHWAAAAAVGAGLVLPLVGISIRENGAVHWITRPGLTDLRILFQDYFGVTTGVAVLLSVCAIVAVLPPAGWWGRRGRLRQHRATRTSSFDGTVAGRRASATAGQSGATAAPGAGAAKPESSWWSTGGISLPSVAAPLLVVPAALLFGESLVAAPLYVDRYVLYGEAGAALLAGAGMYRIGQWLRDATNRRTLLWVPGVVVCALALLLQLAPQQRIRTPESRSYDFGSASKFVGAHAQRGDGVLFFSTFYRKARLGYPADFAKISDFAMAMSPQQAGTFRGRNKPVVVTNPLMLGHERIWVIGHKPSDRLPPGEYRESVALKSNFFLVLRHHFRGMIVTLWQRR